MAQHGYLREYDEGRDYGDDHGRDEREREWRGTERNRSFMIGDRGLNYGDEDLRDHRGGMSHYGREHGYGGFQGDYGETGREQGGFGGRGDYEGGRTSFTGSTQDDHYRSWRDRQIGALDRDYADYCREREQQFHSDFDSWRQNRRQRQGAGSTGESMELTEQATISGETSGGTSPMGAATLATNNPEDTTTRTGRRR